MVTSIGWQLKTNTIAHPHVVIDENRACALTTNMNKISVPGNILLDVGEGDLPKQSIVEVSKTVAIEDAQLGDYIGSLTERRVEQILANLRFVRSWY